MDFRTLGNFLLCPLHLCCPPFPLLPLLLLPGIQPRSLAGLSGTLPCAVHSALRGDCSTAGAFSPGSLQGPRPNPIPKSQPSPHPHPTMNSHLNPTPDPPLPLAPYFSPPRRSLDWCGFGPGDVPGPNLNACQGPLPMGISFPGLKMPGTWEPETEED